MRALVLISLLSLISIAHADDMTTVTPATETVSPTAPPIKREPARIPSAAEAEAMREGEHRRSGQLGFFLGLDASLGKDIYFSNASVNQSGADYTGNATIESNLAVGIRAGLEMMPIYSFGFQASIAVETPRTVTAVNQNISNTTIGSSVNSNTTIQFNLIEASGVYRWNQYYALAGLNYSLPVGANFGTSTASYTMNGFIGGQAGVGAIFYDQLHVEVLFDAISMQMSATGTGNTYTENFGSGVMLTGSVRAHWTF